MNQASTDLEANLVTRRRSLTDSTQDQSLLQDTQTETSAENDQGEPTDYMHNSMAFNFIAIFVPGPKILASLAVLFAGGVPCIGSKQIWILCMIVHDILHFIAITLRMQCIMGMERLNAEDSQESQADLNQQPDQGGISDTSENILQNARMTKIVKKRTLAKNLYSICTYCWLALFLFWLELNIILDESECDTQQVDNLVIAYVILGWIWLLNPLLICVAGCLCFPVLLMVLCLFGKPNQTAASKVQLKNLEVKPYTPDLPGNKECAICIVDYQSGENIVQLECSEMHHFHENCIKDWLKINGQCPICRAKLGEIRKPSSNSASMSTQAVQSEREHLRL